MERSDALPASLHLVKRDMHVLEHNICHLFESKGFENGDAWYGTEGLMVFGKAGRYQLFGPRNKLIEESSGSPPDLAAPCASRH